MCCVELTRFLMPSLGCSGVPGPSGCQQHRESCFHGLRGSASSHPQPSSSKQLGQSQWRHKRMGQEWVSQGKGSQDEAVSFGQGRGWVLSSSLLC